MTAAQRYLDDFTIGETFDSPPRVLSRDVFRAFAHLTGDAHPIHDDERYAKDRNFRGPVAHGLLLASITALGAADISRSLESSMVAFLSQDATFRRPVIVGDRVQPRFEVLAVDPLDETRGTLDLAVTLVGPDDLVMMEGHQRYLLRRRSSRG